VDDHAIVRTGLARLLETQSDLTVCGEAEDAAQAIEGVAHTRPDLVIVDLVLPGRDGLELIGDLSHRHPRIPALACSVHNHLSYAERALRAGAKGYVCKSEGLHQPETLRVVGHPISAQGR
jgi:DNA-binding NarL/FixJ family response regulator